MATKKSTTKKTMTKKTAAKKKTTRRKKAAVSTKTARSAVTVRKKASLIGVDPLASIKGKRSEPEQTNVATQVSQPISFNSHFNIKEVAETRKQLQSALDNCTSVQLDFTDVEVVDTAALQLLLAFTNDARKREVSIVWNQPAEALYRSAELLGLANELGLPK